MFLDSIYSLLKGILSPFLEVPILGNIFTGILAFLDSLDDA